MRSVVIRCFSALVDSAGAGSSYRSLEAIGSGGHPLQLSGLARSTLPGSRSSRTRYPQTPHLSFTRITSRSAGEVVASEVAKMRR